MSSLNITYIIMFMIAVFCGCSPSGREKYYRFSPEQDSILLPEWKLRYNEDKSAIQGIAIDSHGVNGWACGLASWENLAGVIYQLKNGKWSLYSKNEPTTANKLWNVRLTEDLSRGWMVGDAGTILKLEEGHWKRDPNIRKITSDHLWDLEINPDGSRGFVVGDRGCILYLKDGEWSVYHGTSLSSISHKTIYAIAMNESLSFGFAVGTGGMILRYKNAHWEIDLKGSKVSQADLNGVWMDESGQQAWTVGAGGVVLRFEGGKWEKDTSVSMFTDSWLKGVAFMPNVEFGIITGNNLDGAFVAEYSEGIWKRNQELRNLTDVCIPDVELAAYSGKVWMATCLGEMIESKGGKWQKAFKNEALSGETLLSINFSEDENTGIISGYNGEVLYHRNDHWGKSSPISDFNATFKNDCSLSQNGEECVCVGEKGRIATFSQKESGKWNTQYLGSEHFHNVWTDESGYFGWAIGNNGTLAKLEGETWSLISSSVDSDLWDIVVTPDRSYGWIVGSEGTVLKLIGGSWQNVETPEIKNKRMDGVWLSPNGKNGWMVGEEGTILRLSEKGEWVVDTLIPMETRTIIRAVAFDLHMQTGWVVAGQGRIFGYINGRWQEYIPDFQDLNGWLVDVWVSKDGDKGWIIGEHGLIYELITTRIPAPEIIIAEKDLEALKGSIQIKGTSRVEKIECRVLRAGQEILGQNLFNIKPVNADSSSYEIDLNSLPGEIIKASEGRNCEMELQIFYEHPSLEISNRLSQKFRVSIPFSGYYWGPMVVLALIFMLLLAAASILLSYVSLDFRMQVLRYNRFFLKNFLLYSATVFPLLKSKLFWETQPKLKSWEDLFYIPPQLRIAPIDASSQGEITECQDCLEYLIHQKGGTLTLVIGESGMGKTRLLQNWYQNHSLIPLFMRLRGSLDAKERFANNIDSLLPCSLDDLQIDRFTQSGGFLILFDGLNEDFSQETTQRLIKRLSRNNTVILSSQFLPDWQLPPLNTFICELLPFGKKELQQLMDPFKVDLVWDSPNLKELATIPQMAILIAKFILQNNELPQNRLEIFANLLQYHSEKELFSLKSYAWETFKLGIEGRKRGEYFNREVESYFIKEGVLALTEEGYLKFRHDLFQAYYTACHIEASPKHDLQYWTDQVQVPLPVKIYWPSVMEFLREVHKDKTIQNPTDEAQFGNYISFLFEMQAAKELN